MSADMLSGFGMAFLFLLFGIAFVFINLILSRILRPTRPQGKDKLSPYECGERILGPSQVRFNLRFYLIALMFIIFDVETAFLYPCAVVLKRMGSRALIEIGVFAAILLLGLIYLWTKGDLEWFKEYTQEPSASS